MTSYSRYFDNISISSQLRNVQAWGWLDNSIPDTYAWSAVTIAKLVTCFRASFTLSLIFILSTTDTKLRSFVFLKVDLVQLTSCHPSPNDSRISSTCLIKLRSQFQMVDRFIWRTRVSNNLLANKSINRLISRPVCRLMKGHPRYD